MIRSRAYAEGPPELSDDTAETVSQDELGFGPEPSTTDAATSNDDLGFGSSEPSASTSAREHEEEPSAFRLSGTLWNIGGIRVKTSAPDRIANLRQVLDLRLEFDPTSASNLRLRAIATLHTEADYIYLSNLAKYDSQTIDSMAWQARPGDTYLSIASAPVELSFGYQVINLGQGEMLSLLDFVSPRDLREPLPIELTHLRLPVLATRLSIGSGGLQVSAIAVHQPDFGLLPPPLGEFSPFRRLLLANPSVGQTLAMRTLRIRHDPESTLSDVGATQVYGRVSYSSGPVDLTAVVASTLDAVGIPVLPEAAGSSGPTVDLPLLHPRYTVLGQTGALTAGPFIVRWELTASVSKPIAVQRTDTVLLRWSMERRHVVSGMLGVSYSPTTQTSAALEATLSYVVDNPERTPALQLRPLFPIEAPQLIARFNHQFWRERATISLMALLIGIAPFNGLAARAELSYAISDRIAVAAGYILYQSSERFGVLYGLDRHDRAFVSLRWDVGG